MPEPKLRLGVIAPDQKPIFSFIVTQIMGRTREQIVRITDLDFSANLRGFVIPYPCIFALLAFFRTAPAVDGPMVTDCDAMVIPNRGLHKGLMVIPEHPGLLDDVGSPCGGVAVSGVSY